MENKPKGWPEQFERTDVHIFIIEDGKRILVDADDLRLMDVKEVLIVEGFKRKPDHQA